MPDLYRIAARHQGTEVAASGPVGMLYLASSSPRRRQLLEHAGLDYQLVTPGPEPEGIGSPVERARQRARSKARKAVVGGEPGWVLGADTVIVCGVAEFGKPRDRGHARAMLQAMSGTEHEVHTALCVVTHPGGGWLEDAARASVRCRVLDPAVLEAYLDSGQWQGKAGAYGIQDEATVEFFTLHAELDKAHASHEAEAILRLAPEPEAWGPVMDALEGSLEAWWRFLDGIPVPEGAPA